VRDQQLTVFRAVVYNIYGARLFTAQIARHQNTTKRTEQSLFVDLKRK